MNWNKLFHDSPSQDLQGGLASWEEPYLPPMQRIRKHWRTLRVHLWGPAGSMIFHVAAVGALLAFTAGNRTEYQASPPVDIPTNHKEEPIELKPDETVKPEEQTPDPVADLKEPVEDITPYAIEQNSLEPIGNNGQAEDGAGMGSTLTTSLNKNFEIDSSVRSRLTLIGLNSEESGIGRIGRWKKYIGSNPKAPVNENAVLCALRWLKREQQTDGSWMGSKQNVLPAMTSLALLAFLAHGEKPEYAEFGPTVKRAIEWLLADQESDGHFKGRDAHDYTQPIAAYALCEAYALTGHLQVKEAAVRAITPVVRGQNASGGFNYNLDQSQRNDSSYMAWCCQALKAAKSAGLLDDVPGLAAAMKKAVAGFKLNADPSGGFGYAGSGKSGLSGAGALCLQLLGAPTAPEVVATLQFLETSRFSFDTPDQQPYGGGSQLYYWYYITQAKFNHSKATFEPWDKQFAPELRRTQQIEKNAIAGPDGKMRDVGHWDSPVKGEHTGGVVQDTALCTLMLEVYYRYLSTCQTMEIDPEVAALVADVKKDDDVVAVIR